MRLGGNTLMGKTSLTSMECVERATVQLVGTGPTKSCVLCRLPYPIGGIKLFCEKCLRSFAECKCYKGKARVRQYIDLIRKELNAMEDIVIYNYTYYFRVGGLIKPAKVVVVVNQPLHLLLSANFEFAEKDGYDKIQKEGPYLTPIKVKVITEMELLDTCYQPKFKQLIKPLLFIAVACQQHDADTLTAEWTLGSK